MIRLSLILQKKEELSHFLDLFPPAFLGDATDFVKNHLHVIIDDSAKVQRGMLSSVAKLESMGLFFDGVELFLVDRDFSSMSIDLAGTFHGIVLGKGSDPLVRACSLKALESKAVTVFDFTAGTLKDSLHLVKAGFKVVAFERHPVVYLLLKNALNRSSFNSELALFYGDPASFGKTFFTEHFKHSLPQVIYFDPMFEGTLEKSAKPRKEMLFFHQLFKENFSFFPQNLNGENLNNTDKIVLDFALDLALKKVVVKRAPKAPTLKKPTFEFLSKTVRFDVYDVSAKNFLR